MAFLQYGVFTAFLHLIGSKSDRKASRVISIVSILSEIIFPMLHHQLKSLLGLFGQIRSRFGAEIQWKPHTSRGISLVSGPFSTLYANARNFANTQYFSTILPEIERAHSQLSFGGFSSLRNPLSVQLRLVKHAANRHFWSAGNFSKVIFGRTPYATTKTKISPPLLNIFWRNPRHFEGLGMLFRSPKTDFWNKNFWRKIFEKHVFGTCAAEHHPKTMPHTPKGVTRDLGRKSKFRRHLDLRLPIN